MTLLSLLCMYNVLAKVGVDSMQMKCKFRVMSSSELAVMASSCPEISHVKLRATSCQIHSCFWSNKSHWSKILPQPKMATKTQRNKLSNKRFWRQFRWFLAEILYSVGLGFKPCSRSVFTNRVNSKLFKRGKEEYAFSVDKKLRRELQIRLCTWSFTRDLREFPSGIGINYWRKEVNQGGSAPFAIESYGRSRQSVRIFISIL